MAKLIRMIIVALVIIPAFSSWAGQEETLRATALSYVDVKTGHKYIQNGNGSYKEFSRKGKLLRKNFSGTSALLVSGKNIRPIEDKCFLVYEKMNAGVLEHKILPGHTAHPKDWRCVGLICMGKDFKI